MKRKAVFVLVLAVILSLTSVVCVSADDGWTYESYLNKFQIELPDVWRDYCIIDDCSFGIAVRFYGKSVPGKGYNYGDGLFLFFIGDEEFIFSETLDSITYVGTVNGKNYYFATSTDASADPILLYNDFEKTEAIRRYGAMEYRRIKEDFSVYEQMMDGVKDIISSFKPCESE